MRTLLLLLFLMPFACCAQTIEQVRQELKRQGVPHYEIVLAQARHETGNFKSRLCKVNKNLFGIKRGDRYASFDHWSKSIAYYKAKISSRFDGGDYYAFLKRIGYAQDPQYIAKLKKYK